MTEHIKINGVMPRIRYVGNGTNRVFSVPFAIFESTDLKVYIGETLQASSNYTLSDAPFETGTLTFNTAPTNESIITLQRTMSFKRTTDFQEGSALRAKVLNDELDYQTACLQEVADNLNRSMVLPPYAVGTNVNLTLPVPSAGKAIVWNAAGTNLENSTVSVNAMESTLNGYKTAAETAATTASNQATIATTQATTATQQANIAAQKAAIATQKAQEATTILSSKANKDLSNVAETDARNLPGNRVWISGEYDLSSSANVVISHNLGLSDITKAIAIPYAKFTTATAGYAVNEIISDFNIISAVYTPSMTASAHGYSNFLNLTENTATICKCYSTACGISVYNKSTGAITLVGPSNVKIFIKIIY